MRGPGPLPSIKQEKLEPPSPLQCAARVSVPGSAQRDFLQLRITAQRWVLKSWNSAHASFMGFLYCQ